MGDLSLMALKVFRSVLSNTKLLESQKSPHSLVLRAGKGRSLIKQANSNLCFCSPPGGVLLPREALTPGGLPQKIRTVTDNLSSAGKSRT